MHLNLSLILDRKPIIACQKAYGFNVYLIYIFSGRDHAEHPIGPKVIHTVLYRHVAYIALHLMVDIGFRARARAQCP